MANANKKTGRFSRQKGKVYERAVAHKLNAWAGIAKEDEVKFCRRWAGRKEVPVGGDLICPTWFPYIIEARLRKTWSMESVFTQGNKATIIAWWHELKEKNKYGKLLLVFSKDNYPDYVMYGVDERDELFNLFGNLQVFGTEVRIGMGLCDTDIYIMLFDDMLAAMDCEAFKMGL